MAGRIWSLLLALLLTATAVHARTLVVAGRLSSEVTVTQRVTFGVDGSLAELTYRFPLPARVGVPTTRQQVSGEELECRPRPDRIEEETDGYGNRFKVVTWKRLSGDARADLVFTATLDAVLDPLPDRQSFPLKDLPDDTRLYLMPSPLVQSDASAVSAKAASLTAGAATEAAAVEAILNFVADHIRYETPPEGYDALFGLETGTGNCQNYAHLACALLRASGIPARVAIGLTLKDKWKIPLDGSGSWLAQGMGEGPHAWIEVYFPGAGWLPYDPQQSKRFTSTRHIKYAHGPDSAGLGSTWRGTPVLPRYQSVISSSFRKDLTDLSLKGSQADPRGYITGNEVAAVPREDTTPPRARKPAGPPPLKAAPPPARPAAIAPVVPDGNGAVIFGNLRFPETHALFIARGDRAEAAFERETAEYVTSAGVYAQAFTLDRPLRLEKVSLALKKFGGDGSVYVDIVADDRGRPAVTRGVRTQPVYLEGVKRLPVHGWVDFHVPADSGTFPAGKYWLVLRRSGEAIVTWYYTPGKPYGGPDDTRSTAKGWRWEDVLTYDFVFKVSGREPR